MLNRLNIPYLGKPMLLKLKEPKCLTLKNGVKAYAIEAGNEAVTRVDIVLKAGSVYQKKKLVAHAVSHLLQEGTANLNAKQIAEKLDYCGAYFDVNIAKDTTTLTLFSLTKHLKELLPVVQEMLCKATFPQEEINIHLERQRQEYLVNIEKVRYMASLEFNKLIFGEKTAYGQVLEIEDFEKLNRDDLVNFYTENFIPGESYLILSGKVDHAVIEIVERHFGNGWTVGGRQQQPDIRYASNNPQKEQFIEKQESMQSAIRLGRQMVSKLHPDYNSVVLLNTVLGGYFGSRLMSNLREDKGFTYGINSFLSNYLHSGYFSITTEVNAQHTQAALAEIYKEIKLLREKRIGHEELKLVKQYIHGTFLRNFDGPFALAERFRSVRDFGLGFEFYQKNLQEMSTIDAHKLIETANKYLQQEDLRQLVVGKMND